MPDLLIGKVNWQLLSKSSVVIAYPGDLAKSLPPFSHLSDGCN